MYFWAEGFHPPKGVDVQAIGLAVERDSDPKALFEASKNKGHCLHSHLWTDGDDVWANKARIEECRHIITAIKYEHDIGGKIFETRVVEFVRTNGSGQWAKIEEILSDTDLQNGYLAEIQRLVGQAHDKLDNFRQMLSAKSPPPPTKRKRRASKTNSQTQIEAG